MTTGRSVHVDRFKAVQVRGCLLVSHADTSATDNLKVKSTRSKTWGSRRRASARTELLVTLGRQTRNIRQIAAHNPRLSHAHQLCDADTQKSGPRYTPPIVKFIAECRNNPHSLPSVKSCLD